jgi:IMP dehydrogenase
MREALTFDDVLIVPGFNEGFQSRADVNTKTKVCGLEFDVPIISANMDTITGYEMAASMSQLGGLGILHRFMSIEDNVHEYKKAIGKSHKFDAMIGVSVGMSETFKRLEALYGVGARLFCLDVAYAYNAQVIETVQEIKKQAYEDLKLIVGNVATGDGYMALRDAGADAVKVGVRPGSVCTTRVKTGIGMPQLAAIMSCAAHKGYGMPEIIADGGIRNPGDAAKALAAGADIVMMGGIFAGTDETPGEQVGACGEPCDPEGEQFKIFRGMASKEANGDVLPEWKTAEGIQTKVPLKGPVREVIHDFVGGIRSAMTYVGAGTLQEFKYRAKFVRVTPSAVAEGRPHILGG